MNDNFMFKDVIHKIAVKFIPAFLPNAKKTYNLKAVHQPELDIHDLAAKALVYDINTSPVVIEEGLTAGMRLMYYLAADGYRIKTPVFNLSIRVPGEYSGSETYLHDGIFPMARLRVNPSFRKYLRERVKVEFDGKDDGDGMIAEARDHATGLMDEVMTRGNILTIYGWGLKIDADEGRKEEVGVYFKPANGAPVKAEVIAVNEPKTLKVLVPTELIEGTAYQITVDTMCSSKNSVGINKNVRSMQSDFMLIAA
ncbi:MAG: DUF4469 domain-containing protein [Treponema sp.]|jgi:hypothetical protein|nr:DUF4469 domain-containing protein [Treponema sp.]